MAEADISLDICCDTEKTIAPKTLKIKIMERSREIPLCLLCLFDISFIDNPHPYALGEYFAPRGKIPVS